MIYSTVATQRQAGIYLCSRLQDNRADHKQNQTKYLCSLKWERKRKR